MTGTRRSIYHLLLTISFATICGCGSGVPEPKLNPVTGTVMMDGWPVVNAAINFVPDNGPPSAAITDEGGNYEMRFKTGSKGAVVGLHRVIITTDLEGANTPEAEKIPDKFNKNTSLFAEVKPGKNEINFDLVSKDQ